MKWKLLVAIGAIVGGAAVAAQRKSQKGLADAELWAEATDPVAPSGA